MNETLLRKIRLLPNDPGCYMMKDIHGDIIYVGKAKNLKSRVSSYFSGAHNYKTTKMVSLVDDFELMLTSTEKESLILEINLIKKHRPRFNIIFMDDKTYPYLKVSRSGRPVVIVSRDKKQSPAFIYFGPYPNAKAARDMAEILNHSIPQEGLLLPNTQSIYQQFNRQETHFTDLEYQTWRDQIVSILNGNVMAFYDALESKMYDASSQLRFELAANYKTQMEAIDYIADRQQVQFSMDEQFDVFNYSFDQGFIAIVGMFVRRGQLIERSMAVEASLEEPQDALISFMIQFYEQHPLPKKIYVPQDIELDLFKDLLDVEVVHAYRGKKRALLEITELNAHKALTDQIDVLQGQEKNRDIALVNLAKMMGTTKPISRIEIFDNSHIGGEFTVSACVVFDHGEPNKDQYRRYKLHTGNDDTASMKEVIYRRYFRLLSEGARMPDLILVDGGLGQLNAALQILESLDLNIPVAGLVKDDYHRTSALLLSDKTLISMKAHDPAYLMLMYMQDEVHRFAISYHRLLRKKAMTKSILDEVEGLGPKRQKDLFKHFKTLRKMKSASVEELSEVVPQDVAQSIHILLNLPKEVTDDEK